MRANPGGRFVEDGGRDAMEWQRYAACAELDDPDLFFPISTSGPGAEQVAEAREVCDRCPVTEHCADWARRTGQHTGVWGGFAAERGRLVPVRGAGAATNGRSR